MIDIEDRSDTPPTPEHTRDGLGRWRRGIARQTVSGIWFYALDPRADEIEPFDIGHQLGNVCRWGGTCSRFYSVAEHSVIVSLYAPPELAREALMHDATEAYIGDVTRPIKMTPEFSGYRAIEARLHAAISERFGLRTDAEAHAAIKAIDDRVLVDESRALLQDPSVFEQQYGPALGATIAGLAPSVARSMFLMRFAELFPDEMARARKMIGP